MHIMYVNEDVDVHKRSSMLHHVNKLIQLHVRSRTFVYS